MKAQEIVAQVQKEAAALDATAEGWHDLVDLENFNIQKPESCVLFYTFGNYIEGRNQVLEQVGDVGVLWFCNMDNPNTVGLTDQTWREEIVRRRAAEE